MIPPLFQHYIGCSCSKEWHHMMPYGTIWHYMTSHCIISCHMMSFDIIWHHVHLVCTANVVGVGSIWNLYVTSGYIIWRHLTSYDVMWRHPTCHIIWRHLTSRDVILHHVTSRDVTWGHQTSRDVMWRQLTSQNVIWSHMLCVSSKWNLSSDLYYLKITLFEILWPLTFDTCPDIFKCMLIPNLCL